MDQLESLLREEFDQATHRPRPPAATLIANTRRIRRRRTLAASAGGFAAVVAVVLVATLTVAGLGRGTPTKITANLPRPTTTVSNEQLNVTMMLSGYTKLGPPLSGRFLDAQHGMFLFGRCGDDLPACSAALGVTSDGGSTFAMRALPEAHGALGNGDSQLFVFDAEHLVLNLWPNEPAVTRYFPQGARWTSTDGGVTWQRVDNTVSGDVTTIPPTAQLLDDNRPSRRNAQHILVLNADGTTDQLTTVPVGDPVMIPGTGSNGQTGIDGGYFILTDAGRTLMVSHDHGATWQRATTPAGQDLDQLQLLGTVGGVIYAEGYFTHVLIASADHGLTWTLSALPPLSPIAWPPGTRTDLNSRYARVQYAVLANGLLLTDGAHMWRLRPGSTDDWQPVDDTTSIMPAGSHALALRGTQSDPTLAFTTDGTHWTTLHIKIYPRPLAVGD
jgi:hypothetical protein